MAATRSQLFKKRPIIVSAYQHAGPNPITIHTLEGDMQAEAGDWIITGVKGEKYPCKPDVFAETYERV